MPSRQHQPNNNSDDYLNVKHLDPIGVFLAGVGIAGLVGGVGYVVSFARDEFWGIQTGVRSGSELASIAGEFSVQTVLVFLQQALTHYLLSTFSVVGIAMLFVAINLLRANASRLRLICEVGVVCSIIVLGVLDLLFYCLPVIKLHDTMTTGLGALPGVEISDLVDCRTNRLWVQIVDSRRLSQKSPDPVSVVSPVCGGRNDRKEAREKLADVYIANVTFCCVGWIVLYLAPKNPSSGGAGILAQTAGTAVLIIATIFVPYVFGKIVRSTAMPWISFKPGKSEISINQAQGRIRGRVSTSTEGGISEFENAWETGFLASESDQSIKVFEYVGENSSDIKIVEIPRAGLERFEILGIRDALGDRIARWHPTSAPSAP